MLSRFLHVWLFYWLAVALLPVRSVYPATGEAFLVQLTFVVLVAGTLKFISSRFAPGPMPAAGATDIPCASTLLWIALALSAVGLLALCYDRIFIQGVDFSDGIAYARRQWIWAAKARQGRPSSIFSMVGYLVGSAFYVAAVLAVTQAHTLSPGQRILALVASLMLVLANSVLGGGRSGILLLAAVIIGALGARTGMRLRDLLPNTQRRLLGVLCLVAVAYMLYVFYGRATYSQSTPLQYVQDFFALLGVAPLGWYRDWMEHSRLGTLAGMATLGMVYLTHSFATTAAIWDAAPEAAPVLFVHFADLLYKVGLGPPVDGKWFLVGRLPSLPGALLHQFGIAGLVAGSLILGAGCGLIRVWAIRQPRALLPLGAYAVAEATLLLTPALFAPDILSFPFVIAAIAILAAWVWARAVWKRRFLQA
jgi:hypothetical protein